MFFLTKDLAEFRKEKSLYFDTYSLFIKFKTNVKILNEIRKVKYRYKSYDNNLQHCLHPLLWSDRYLILLADSAECF